MNDQYILAFDSIFSTNNMQLLKVLLPLIPGKYQSLLAFIIKFEELKYTYQYISSHPNAILFQENAANESIKLEDILEELKPFCPKPYLGYLTQIQSVFQLLEQYQEISPILEMLGNGKQLDFLNIFSRNKPNSENKYKDLLDDIFADE